MNEKTKPLIDARIPFRFLFWKFYFVFTLGRDQRITPARIDDDRRKIHRFFATFIYATIFLWIFVCFLLANAFVLYIGKNFLGIDFFSDAHPLSQLLRWLRAC